MRRSTYIKIPSFLNCWMKNDTSEDCVLKMINSKWKLNEMVCLVNLYSRKWSEAVLQFEIYTTAETGKRYLYVASIAERTKWTTGRSKTLGEVLVGIQITQLQTKKHAAITRGKIWWPWVIGVSTTMLQPSTRVYSL